MGEKGVEEWGGAIAVDPISCNTYIMPVTLFCCCCFPCIIAIIVVVAGAAAVVVAGVC